MHTYIVITSRHLQIISNWVFIKMLLLLFFANVSFMKGGIGAESKRWLFFGGGNSMQRSIHHIFFSLFSFLYPSCLTLLNSEAVNLISLNAHSDPFSRCPCLIWISLFFDGGKDNANFNSLNSFFSLCPLCHFLGELQCMAKWFIIFFSHCVRGVNWVFVCLSG